IMVYHRSAWNYYLIGGLIHGVLRGGLFRTRSLLKTVQSQTDGAIARYYSAPEWRTLVAEYFNVETIQVYGSKLELLPMPAGKFKQLFSEIIPLGAARFITNTCGWG